MKPSILLRIASVLTLLYFAGHTLGMPWTPAQGPAEIAVLDAMKSQRFDVTGSLRTYWDFYFGFGVIISVHLLTQGILLWQLATLAKNDAARIRPLVGVFFVSLVANAILAWRFFFAVPVVFAIAIAVSLGVAYASLRNAAV